MSAAIAGASDDDIAALANFAAAKQRILRRAYWPPSTHALASRRHAPHDEGM